jgi:glycerol-1-phosphate dehydrogenase [NAD(P)+]
MNEPPPTREIVIGDDALERLGAYVVRRGWSETLVAMDANTADVAGTRVVAQLSSRANRVSTFCFTERSGLLASESSVARLEEALGRSGPDSIVVVGSGVLTDVTRYVASRTGHEFVSVPTAASQDGYASGVAAMEFAGMKKTFPAVAPVAIFAEPATLAAAPLEMTRSGLGDLLGKATSRVDWLASHALWGEAFIPDVESRVTSALVEAARNVDATLAGSPESTASLLRGLIDSGIAMAIVGSSRPASGAEHHVSHFFDLLAAQGQRPHALHGLQVGYACHFAMALQRIAFGGGVTELAVPDEPRELDASRPWFTGHDDDVRTVLDEKHRFQTEHLASWPASSAAWGEVEARLDEAMRNFPLVERALITAGIPNTPGFLDVDEVLLRAALRYANRLRARYTVLDFLEGQGLLDWAIETVLAATAPC